MVTAAARFEQWQFWKINIISNDVSALSSKNDLIIWFDNLPSEAAVAGGKGASLGRMVMGGLPVPPGFVVSAAALRYFLEG